MRKSLLLLPIVLLVLLQVGARAQDTIKIHVGFQNLNVANLNLPGWSGSVDYKLVELERWRIGAVFDVAGQYDSNNVLDRYQYLAGTTVARSLGKNSLSLFGRALFGATRFESRAGPGFTRGTVSVGGGLDINLGKHFFLRPGSFDFQWIDRRPVTYARLLFGGGARF